MPVTAWLKVELFVRFSNRGILNSVAHFWQIQLVVSDIRIMEESASTHREGGKVRQHSLSGGDATPGRNLCHCLHY